MPENEIENRVLELFAQLQKTRDESSMSKEDATLMFIAGAMATLERFGELLDNLFEKQRK